VNKARATKRSSGVFIGLRQVYLELLPEPIPGDRRTCGAWCAAVFATKMSGNALADTGAILALLDRADRWHRVCADAFAQIHLPLYTSEAVLTELFHLVGNSRVEMEATWKFLRAGALVLLPITDSELPEIHALMSRYWDRPMDFADATLVHLAKRESLFSVFTVDRADFETYRIEGRRRFRLPPVQTP